MKFLLASLILLMIAILVFAGFLTLLYIIFIGPGSTMMNTTCHVWHPFGDSGIAWCYFPPQAVQPTQPWQAYAP